VAEIVDRAQKEEKMELVGTACWHALLHPPGPFYPSLPSIKVLLPCWLDIMPGPASFRHWSSCRTPGPGWLLCSSRTAALPRCPPSR
jgi:hypothetical protein